MPASTNSMVGWYESATDYISSYTEPRLLKIRWSPLGLMQSSITLFAMAYFVFEVEGTHVHTVSTVVLCCWQLWGAKQCHLNACGLECRTLPDLT